jgi:Ca2+-binding RTX toxin-like protein
MLGAVGKGEKMSTTFHGTGINDLQLTGYDYLYGGDGGDRLSADTVGYDVIEGGRGLDYLYFAQNSSSFGSIYGGDSADVLIGGNLADALYGGQDGDWVAGAAASAPDLANNYTPTSVVPDGADFLEGGDGIDGVYGFAGNDFLYGGGGDDLGLIFIPSLSFYSDSSTWTLQAGLFGGAGSDLLDGGRGNDLLHGGGDGDTLIGGADNDGLYGDDGNDTIYADAGQDAAFGGNGNDNIYGTGDILYALGDAGDDVIGGSGYNDSLYGGADGDLLWGYLGNDQLYGGSGIDRLSGYTGNDVMNGGLGLDYFIMNYDIQATGYDNITDFVDGVDFLQLPTYAQGYTTITTTSFGCTVSIALAGSSYNVYISGVSAAQIADQVYYYGV